MIIFLSAAMAASCDPLDLQLPAGAAQGTTFDVRLSGVVGGSEARLYREGVGDPCPPEISGCLAMTGAKLVSVRDAAPGVGTSNVRLPITIKVSAEPTFLVLQAAVPACGSLSNVQSVVLPSVLSCGFSANELTTTCDAGGLGCTVSDWWNIVYPSGLHATWGSLNSAADAVGVLKNGDAATRAALSLQLSIDLGDAGAFGERPSLGDELVQTGIYAGQSAREIGALALGVATVDADLGAAAQSLVAEHHQCEAWMAVDPPLVGGTGGDSGGADSGTTDSGSASVDTGSGPSDSASVDSGSASTDSGTASTDSTTAPTDSGSVPDDSGSAPVDTGSAPTESGVVPTESGSAPEDSGVPVVDDSAADTGTEDTGG